MTDRRDGKATTTTATAAGIAATALADDPAYPEPIRDIVVGLWRYVDDSQYDCEPNLADLLWDQWVVAVVSCEHGRYRGTSRGYAGFTEAVSIAADRFRAAHPPGAAPAGPAGCETVRDEGDAA